MSAAQDKLKALVFASQAFTEKPSEMEALWDSCSSALFSLEDKQKQLGLGNKVGPWERRGKMCLTCGRELVEITDMVSDSV